LVDYRAQQEDARQLALQENKIGGRDALNDRRIADGMNADGR